MGRPLTVSRLLITLPDSSRSSYGSAQNPFGSGFNPFGNRSYDQNQGKQKRTYYYYSTSNPEEAKKKFEEFFRNRYGQSGTQFKGFGDFFEELRKQMEEEQKRRQ